MAEDSIRISHDALVATILRALAAAGVPELVRKVEAQIMAEADLLGVPSHGVRMLPGLLQALGDGRVHPAPDLRFRRERLASCLLDCDYGPGRYVALQGMMEAVGRAREYGAGVCLAANTTHWGRAHAYAERAARAGMVGICTTNAIPSMVVWGSARPLLGNNPLAIAVPRGEGEDPIVLDMAMSQAAVGKLGTYAREGRRAAPGWGQDAEGNPTDDPAAILASGRVLPFGEHKGTGMALMMELLTAALAGGLFTNELAQRDPTGMDPGASKLFMALDVTAFVDPERFAARVDDLLTYLRSAEPGLQVTYPGQRGWETRDRYLAEGIPIHIDIVKQLQRAGVELAAGQ